ncbi:flippase [Peribacillus sp. R9-11]|uniref:flippase n=1 Tax=Peribacillus sp. R9-11 TaxID=3073271 RepID=UPI0028693884|nr:flippase [Peribacillus sp. R9-11]WMX54274.1 flippase [Peribacillus sp. R9-11]
MALKQQLITLKKRFSGEVVDKIIKNASWLISDKMFTMAIGVFVTAVIARYFGPEQFGQFNYALAFVSLFTAISTLGLDTLIVKSIIDKKVNEGVILCTSLVLRVIGGSALIFLAALIIRIIEPMDTNLHMLVLVMSFTMIVKSFEVIEYWIQAYQRAKISSLIRMSVYVIISALKILLVLKGGTLIQYALIYTLDAVVISAALLIAYFNVREEKLTWKFNFSYAKNILSQSWYLIVSGLMITIYMRIDQVMLGAMMPTKSEVGIYSAAVRIAEMWYFVPMAIITSFKPVIMKYKNINEEKYINSIQLLYTLIAWTGIGFGIAILILAKPLVSVLYGVGYLEATSILSISVWAGTFALLGSARSVWLITEGLQKYTLVFMMTGVIVNIVLNIFLIPYFGGIGAAIATLASQIMVAIIIPLFFSKTKISSIAMFRTLRFDGIIKRNNGKSKKL